MKIQFTNLLFLICLSTAFGQTLYVPGGTLGNNTTNANVGIGISTPSTALQIMDPNIGGPPTTATPNQGVLLSGNSTGGSLNMGIDATGTLFYSWIQSRNRTNNTNIYNLSLNPSGGNVGVGVMSPELALHVLGGLGFPGSSGTSQTGVLRLQGTGSNGVLDFSVNGGSGASLQVTNRTDLSQMYPLLLNPNGGNVGIGTSAPLNGLNIFGLNNFNAGSIRFGHSGANDGVVSLGYNTPAGRDALKLSYFPHNSTSSQVDLMTLDTNGNVGIGTSTPLNGLNVSGPNFSAGSIRFGYSASNDGVMSLGYNTPAGRDALKLSYFPHNTTSSQVDLMTLDTNGNVGIGTSTPLNGLNVSGLNFNAGSIRFGYSGSNDGVVSLGYNTSTGRDALKLSYFPHNSTASQVDLLTLDTNGNVGIGNASPDAKLAVSGLIHGQEVQVSVTVPGPDYVFEKGYKFPSLDDLKTYIDQHKHLPEVPSAKEMEKDGVRLGEMDMLLLKKVEELTLYIMELKKDNERQQVEINELRNSRGQSQK